MQIIRENAAALYEDMEKNMKLFKRESYEDNFEEYDDCIVGDIELPEEQKKQIKKAMWDKLGEYMLNL